MLAVDRKVGRLGDARMNVLRGRFDSQAGQLFVKELINFFNFGNRRRV